ncbi:MAG: protein tyrosine phosphatase family protein [Pseudomonadota bacterium]
MADPEDILNWRRVDDRLTLSGQPTAEQCTALARSGVQCVINLAPQDNKGAVQDEDSIFADLGLAYYYIPVDFDAPTDADYAAFCAAMAQHASDTVHVHCIYNARVTAFMMRYANDGRGGDVEEARERMDGIWRPGGVWARFLGDETRVDAPNEYAGYQY